MTTSRESKNKKKDYHVEDNLVCFASLTSPLYMDKLSEQRQKQPATLQNNSTLTFVFFYM